MRIFDVSSPLLEEAGDGAQGGGSGSGTDKAGAVAFDPAAFKGEILGELNKLVQGALKAQKNDFTKLIQGSPQAKAGGTAEADKGEQQGGETATEKGGKAGDPEKNAIMLEFKKFKAEATAEIEALKKTNEDTKAEAENTRRSSALRDALSNAKYEFVSTDAYADAIQIFTPAVQRGEDGAYVAGDLPLDKYVETQLSVGGKKSYLIKQKDIGGAGARGGKPGTSKKWDLERDLSPANFQKLTPQEQAELRQHIASSL